MTFECFVMFDANEIEEFAKDAKKLSLYSKYYSQPFFSVPINRGNLIPNSANFFTLNEYANDYYVSIDFGASKVKYADGIKRNGRLNIYRINQNDSHYKRITSEVLYTKCSYIAVSEDEDCIDELVDLQNIELDGVALSFITLGRRFYAIRFRIHYADYLAKLFFQKHELQIETSESPTGGNKLEKAVNYVFNHKETLMNYLLDGRCEISNNAAERRAKSYVTGRKNFLFHDTVNGAKASAIVLSLIETAKANSLNIYQYLYTLLLYMPDYKNEPAGIKQLMPWSEFIKERCFGGTDTEKETSEKRGNLPI